MRKSENYEMNLFDEDEFYNEERFNENTEKIDEALKSLENPEYDVSKQTEVEKLSSRESLKVALRKLAKAVADYISHKADKVAHITEKERTTWDAKLGVEKIAANLTTDKEGMVLAAAMGKTLKEQIDTNASAISALNTDKLNFYAPSETSCMLRVVSDAFGASNGIAGLLIARAWSTSKQNTLSCVIMFRYAHTGAGNAGISYDTIHDAMNSAVTAEEDGTFFVTPADSSYNAITYYVLPMTIF